MLKLQPTCRKPVCFCCHATNGILKPPGVFFRQLQHVKFTHQSKGGVNSVEKYVKVRRKVKRCQIYSRECLIGCPVLCCCCRTTARTRAQKWGRRCVLPSETSSSSSSPPACASLWNDQRWLGLRPTCFKAPLVLTTSGEILMDCRRLGGNKKTVENWSYSSRPVGVTLPVQSLLSLMVSRLTHLTWFPGVTLKHWVRSISWYIHWYFESKKMNYF